MTIEQIKAINIPPNIHERPIMESLLEASGISDKSDSSKFNLAHIAIMASKLDHKWFVFAIDPANLAEDSDKSLGSFKEDGELSNIEILETAEDWLRNSDSIDFIPGKIITLNNESDPDFSIGHILLRAKTNNS